MDKPRRTLVLEKRLHSGTTAPRQYVTGIDILHGHVCVPIVFVYKKGFDLAHAEKALVETLKHYALVSGRYKKDEQGQVYNDGQDHGIDWRVFQCKGPMPYSEHQPLGDHIKHYYPSFMPWQVIDKDRALLHVNINQFEDGGIVLAVTFVHSTFDALSVGIFMLNWSKISQGKAIDPLSFDRQVVIDAGKTDVDTSDFKLLFKPGVWQATQIMSRLGWRALTSVRKEIFRVPAPTIQRWKAQAEAELPEAAKGITAARLVSAYVLRAISPNMPKGVPRSISMAVDMRFVRGLTLPRNYFGNGLCYAKAVYTEQELATQSLAVLAERCKPPAEEVSAPTVSKLLTLVERARQAKNIWRLVFRPAVDTLEGGIVQNNLSLMPIYDVDFGSGPPDWYETFAMTVRMMGLVPTPQKDGGIDLHMAASKAELDALRKAFAADGIKAKP